MTDTFLVRLRRSPGSDAETRLGYVDVTRDNKLVVRVDRNGDGKVEANETIALSNLEAAGWSQEESAMLNKTAYTLQSLVRRNRGTPNAPLELPAPACFDLPFVYRETNFSEGDKKPARGTASVIQRLLTTGEPPPLMCRETVTNNDDWPPVPPPPIE